jgi:hypothetical protein
MTTSVSNVSADNVSLGVRGDGDGDGDVGVACCVPGMETVVVPLVFSLVVVLGWVGNALVIYVVLKNRDYLRNTTNLFILNLAIADLLFLTFCVPFHAVIYTTMTWPFGEVLCKLVHFVQYSSMVASIFTLVAMAADRYCAVAYALQTKHFRTPVIAFIASLCIWLGALAIAVPWPIFYTVKTYNDKAPYPVTICSDDWGVFRDDKPGYFLFLFFIAYIFPLVAIFVLSVLMVRQLWVLKEPEGPSMRASVSAKRKVTRLIIVVVVVFCLCWLPSHIIWIWTNYSLHTWRYTYTFYYFRIAAYVLAYGNSAMNPLIYAFLSVNFRKGFQQALRCSTQGERARGGGVVTQRIVFSKPSFSFSVNHGEQTSR